MFQHLHFLFVPKLEQKPLFCCHCSCSCHKNHLQRNHSLYSAILLESVSPLRVLLSLAYLYQSFPLYWSRPTQYMECRTQLPVHPHLHVIESRSVEEGSW
ncbi:hypothetical protein CFC21_065167 [Triticum aestivum]|uniref:Uncharacterized protein n=4 Tax=Triticum TaxID=4564 RepID=A0A9R0TM59_TRITD|nr:hypothetical protein TRIUR3_16348 [Triticum urartu]KAF7058032.1 hypothetical protein CFC21_065167 [Triticum aestivum]VAI15830.1 unnamed protein product [Triticum turgidum subsp. durum]